MRQRAPLALLALAAQLGCGPQEASPLVTDMPTLPLCLGPRGEPPFTLQAYPYHYHEATYSKQLIQIAGVDHEIQIDRVTSDPEALNALYALKWNVLYPNSKGKITLIGTHDPNEGTFSLQHWTLETPFIEYFGENPLEYPTFPIFRDELVSEDFRRPIRHDPRIYHQSYFEEWRVCE